MTAEQTWTDWPSEEAVRRSGMTPFRRRLSFGMRWVVLGAVLWSDLGNPRVGAGGRAALLGPAAVLVVALWGFSRAATARWLWRSIAALAAVMGVALGAPVLHGNGLAGLALCAATFGASQRLPLKAAVPFSVAAVWAMVLVWPHSVFSLALTALALGVLGYVVRQDWESRAATHRLLEQERALRAAEAEAAALAERGRIAREIHDVLAHSLSAQLVHLEAARLMLDAGAASSDVRGRVLAARRMAQDGLSETRQALSALRGEFPPVGEYLAGLARDEGAQFEVSGTVRPLTAEIGLAVRRAAQEAVTNVRKHAPGASCTVLLRFLNDAVQLEVANGPAGAGAAPYGLAHAGGGYGLLGMRERAELLGGVLSAEPDEKGGFRVALRIPTQGL